MANFVVNHAVKAYTPETVIVSGRFAPAGTGAPTYPDSGKNRGWTVVRTSAGLFTVTFANFKWLSLEHSSFGVRVATAAATIVQGGDWSSSAGTLQIRLFQETADPVDTPTGDTNTNTQFELADLSADADNEVSFSCTFRTASV